MCEHNPGKSTKDKVSRARLHKNEVLDKKVVSLTATIGGISTR